jgi:NAD-dependent deacetylase
MIVPAAELASKADIFIVVGTSMLVYPAAGLIDYVPAKAHKYLVDPNAKDIRHISNLHVIAEKAGTGLVKLVDELLAQ